MNVKRRFLVLITLLFILFLAGGIAAWQLKKRAAARVNAPVAVCGKTN